MNTASNASFLVFRSAFVLLLLLLLTGVCKATLAMEDVYSLANESRTVVAPARKYCSGGPTQPERNLYISPACTMTTVQRPLLNRSGAVQYESRAVANLSFCCKSNYTAVVPVGSNLTELDNEARFLYNEAVKGIIGRYDCRGFYPYHTCAHCLYAYRSWVCAVTLPMACATEDGLVERLRMCDHVCLEVIRKCPIELGFSCPVGTNTMYAVAQSIDPFTVTKDISAGAAGCNPMDYAISSSVGSASSAGARRGALVLAALSVISVLFTL